MHSFFFPKIHTKWQWLKLHNRPLILFSKCSWDSSRNNFFWHVLRVIPQMITRWQQRMNIHDDKHYDVIKMPTRCQQRMTIHDYLHLGVILKIPTRWQKKINFYYDIHLGVSFKILTRWQQKITLWYALPCFSQDAHKMAAEKNIIIQAHLLIYKSSWDSSRNNFPCHALGIIPKMPTRWQQRKKNFI